MSKLDDEHFTRLAIEQAYLGAETPGGAEVGTVLVKGGMLCAAVSMKATCATTRQHMPRL
jgi:hypothetical protein